MAKPLEKKSAKILALILALIMLGSVLAYAFRGSTTTPSREVRYSVTGVKESIKLVSDSSRIYYLNLRTHDPNLIQLIDTYWQSLSQDYVFRFVRFTTVNSVFYVEYPSTTLGYYPYLFLFDVGQSKVFFSYDEKRDYMGVDLKIKNGYGFAENVNPIAIGTVDAVTMYIDSISENKKVNNTYADYIDRIPDLDYSFIVVLTGDDAGQIIKMNKSSGNAADFYFEGIAVNRTGGYDKVVAINFKQNIFFIKSNITDYYNVTRYDSLNIAYMHDMNFTEIVAAKPEMRAFIIQPIETNGNESRS